MFMATQQIWEVNKALHQIVMVWETFQVSKSLNPAFLTKLGMRNLWEEEREGYPNTLGQKELQLGRTPPNSF